MPKPKQVDETHACRKFACQFQACLKKVTMTDDIWPFVRLFIPIAGLLRNCTTTVPCGGTWRFRIWLSLAKQEGFQNMHRCAAEVKALKECCRRFNEVNSTIGWDLTALKEPHYLYMAGLL